MNTTEQLFDTGDKVQYRLGDKWLDGVVHGVKKAEAVKGPDIVLGYLVDTGKNERLDKYPYNPRYREMDSRVNKLVEDGTSLEDAIADVETHKDLPKSAEKVETVRQPEQIEVLPENIRAVK